LYLTVGGNISDAPASCYRLTENTALESIKVTIAWDPEYRDMYRSVITNLILSICSPHLRSVNLVLIAEVREVEHFPWGVVNNLTKVSPHMLQKVEIALWLLVETDPHWGITSPLSPDEYEAHFHQIRSALPELDKKVIMSVMSQEVCSSSQLSAGLILMINSSSIFMMRQYVMQEDMNTTNIVSSRLVTMATLVPTSTIPMIQTNIPTTTTIPMPITPPSQIMAMTVYMITMTVT
jgi:hypothetical protein